MNCKAVGFQGCDVAHFFEIIEQNIDEGWQIVPGTMYITSTEVEVPLPAGRRIRRSTVIAFVMIKKDS